MATTKVSTKNTKQELVSAYNQLAKELKAIKAGGGGAEGGAAAPAGGGDGGGGDGDELSIPDIVERLKALTLSIGESSSSLQSALSAEATVLHRLRAEADGYIEQLKTLHGITTHNFPNMFFTGYVQGGLNGTTTLQFGKQVSHAAWIVKQA